MKLFASLLLCLCAYVLSAQESPVQKFGKIKPADFEKKVYDIDTGASAVVLFDMGSAEIEGNVKGWFSVVYKYHKRVHILNKNGFDHADVAIHVYNSNGMEVELENLKAVTYNLVDGKIVETKLEKSAVFKEKIDRESSFKKFTLPNVKEGSIIEFEYRITSDFVNHVRPWVFQGNSPRLWSEFRFSVPQFFNYVYLSQGFVPFHINETKNRNTNYSIIETNGTSASEKYIIPSAVSDHRWVIKNVPAIKKEGFTSTVDNYLSKIEFQLSGYQQPLTPKNIMGTWPMLTKNLMENEYFGMPLKTANNWLGDEVKPLMAAATSEMDKARRIFAHVRDNYTCTDHSSIYIDKGLKDVMKTKKGNVSELNLLLIAMLKYAGLQAEPVILSTSDNGFTYSLYPILQRFNYVVCQATVDNSKIMLDASRQRLGFGKLTPDCYNGHARVVNETATAMQLVSDSLMEKKLTSVFIVNDDKGGWVGTTRKSPGYFESYNIRDKVKSKGEETYFKDLQKEFGMDIKMEKPQIEALNDYDVPVKLEYSFAVNKEDEDILYVNPMFDEAVKDNPFKSAERLYPVEMPYTIDDTYILNMQIPAGYALDELPKQVAVKLNADGDGYFEYLVSKSENNISLRSRLKLNRTVFSPEEYDFLREFFKLIVTKHSEQIVFKKIK
ncbi:MAG: DUF3857 domain-containing protein [Chitinophagaceae bacterium]